MRNLLAVVAGFAGAGLLATAAFSQPLPVPCGIGLPAPDYRCDSVANAFTSIVGAPGTVNAHAAGVDDATTASIPFPAGFSFNYFGSARTSLKICSNGWITFSASTSASASNLRPGDTNEPDDAVFAWWDDLILTNPASSVDYRVDVPGQALTVQWTDVANFTAAGAGTGVFSFQCVLLGSGHPTSPDAILFRYDRSSFQSNMFPCQTTNPSTLATSATVGCENLAATEAAMTGVDATERGAGNEWFPPCDLMLTPVTHARTAATGTSALAVQEPWCSIEGQPLTFGLPAPCAAGTCYEDHNSSNLLGFPIAIPWKFNLYGRPVKSVVMSTNGLLLAGEGTPGGAAANAASPASSTTSSSVPDNLLAPFWDDLEGNPNSRMLYSVDGLPGCRVMTFEWKDFGRFLTPGANCVNGGGSVSMQVKLFEGGAGSLASSTPPCPYDLVVPGVGNDRIEFHYDHAGFVAPPTPFTASIGAENWNGTVGNAVVAGASVAAPPTIGGVGAKGVITLCDTGTIRYYGDATNDGTKGAQLPEIRTNTAAPVANNTFSLEVVGASPFSAAYLLIQFGGELPPTSIPVPCGGIPLGLGNLALWVDPAAANFFLIGPLSTGVNGCTHLDFPIPPGLSGLTVFAQWGVIGAFAVEATEGLRIVLG